MSIQSTSDRHIQSIVDDGETQSFRHRNRGSINSNRNILAAICQSTSILIFLIIIAIIPSKISKDSIKTTCVLLRSVLQIFVGWRYFNACPINQLISHYSMVAGIVSLTLIVLITITQIISRIFAKQMFDETIDENNPHRGTTFVGCGLCSIMCINFSLLIFLIGWTIAGWIWIVEVWHRVQYRRIGRDDYCHPLLYQFNFSVLLLTTTFKLILLCLFCRESCNRIHADQRREIGTSDET